ncbi:hypothetical protein PoB_001211700 [Plakobranchus ocellatus]|uniref:Uncharacterized protein n=1 Tax=Plakobranchus ocellatus TaxID=259542 RepID=A0AAV3YTZ9_9GAST|nr:hypothetical protein PoB_001211700 [Plakobranchus ocellatus]
MDNQPLLCGGRDQLVPRLLFDCQEMTTGHPAGCAIMLLSKILWEQGSKHVAHIPQISHAVGVRPSSCVTLNKKWHPVAQEMEQRYPCRAAISIIIQAIGQKELVTHITQSY